MRKIPFCAVAVLSLCLLGANWQGQDEDLPTMTITAHFRMDGFFQGEPGKRSFRPAGKLATPHSRILLDRTMPVVLLPQVMEEYWRIHLPESWCGPESRTRNVDNAVGGFDLTVSADESTVEIKRRVELRSRWVEQEDFAALKELSLAEHRERKRRVRLKCAG